MKSFIHFFLVLFLVNISYPQNARQPYPIIFVHGITSDYTTWLTGSPSVNDYLNSLGFHFGGVVDVTLDYNRSATTLMNTINEDVHLFPDDVESGDYYFLNFAVHSSGYSTRYNQNYPYPRNITYAEMISSGNNVPVISREGEYRVGDIIRIDLELMLIMEVHSDYLVVNRGVLETLSSGHLNPADIYNLSNESNQASIAKQGYGLYLAINKIKELTGASKVILVGHSMGGLTAREYIRSSYYQNDVAKLVTIGTPHLGAKPDEINDWIVLLPKLDSKNDAMRDLRYNYGGFFGQVPEPPFGNYPDDGVYLFGGYETSVPNEYYSKDINADGMVDNIYRTGLSKNLSTLNPNIDYSWVVSDIFNGLNGGGDICVRLDRQFPYDETIQQIGDTLKMSKRHDHETEDIYNIIRGMDEPDNYQLAYSINQDEKYCGFISFQTNYQASDFDYYRFLAGSNGKLKINIDGPNSGVNEIKLLDQSGSIINSQVIQSFPFNYEREVTAGLYYICLLGNAPGGNELNPYTIFPTLEPIVISLYNGTVTPTTGEVTTNFNFSVYYKNSENIAPDNVQIHIINQFSSNMTANGINWQQGVEFTKTLNNFTPGQYQFYFSATINGQTLRFPDNGYLDFNVTQNVAGWDLLVSNLTYSPTIVTPGTNFSATGSVYNNSNSPDKIYNNVNYSFTFYDQLGDIIGTPQTGTISQITQGQTVPVTKPFTAPSSEGNCQLLFSIFPQIDENTSNNSLSKLVIVSSTGSQKQWLISSDNASVHMNSSYSTHSFNAHTYTLTLANSTTIDIKRDDYANPHHIDELMFRKYDDDLVAVINELCNTGEAYVSFGLDNPGFVTYEQTNITTTPGTTIEFVANCTSIQFSALNPVVYGNNNGLTVRQWYNSYTRFNGNYSIKYRFNIPSSATLGSYTFYMGSKLSDLSRFLRELKLTIIASPPVISSLSSYTFSADDQITINGTGFGTPGSVKFNDLSASQIINWIPTQIKVIVPVGAQSGNLFVVNTNGPSNGMAYNINSSTGEPIVVSPIPDQSIYQEEIKFIANLNSVFSDPNNQLLTFSATSTNPSLIVLQDSLSLKKLYLNAAANATGTSTIIVTATDSTNKSATDTFIVTIIPNQQAYITLISPNGGQNWEIGSLQVITWASNATSGSVRIEITRDGGSSWEIIYPIITDDGIENWIVTGPVTNNAKIRVSDITGSPTDISDNVFSIIPQNLAPTLTWIGEIGYEFDGVDPNEGSNTSTFTFKVKYTDPEGDLPLSSYPKLHILKGGVPIEGSPFVMDEVAMQNPGTLGISDNKATLSNRLTQKIENKNLSIIPKNNLVKGKHNDLTALFPLHSNNHILPTKINKLVTSSESIKIGNRESKSDEKQILDSFEDSIVYSRNIVDLEAGTDYTYYFEAYDIDLNLATGEATIEQNGPIVNLNLNAEIQVNPEEILFNVPSDSNATSDFTLSNIAAPGSQNLNWTLTEKETVTKVLIVGSDEDDALFIRSYLTSFPDISLADYFNARYSTPALNELQNYDVVMAYSNYAFFDKTALGNVLADYVDSGGKVILSNYSNFTGQLDGRFITDNYSAFITGTFMFGTFTLGDFNSQHPIMAGVNSLSDVNPVSVSLNSGANWIADFSNGIPLVAVKDLDVACINAFLGTNFNWTGDMGLLLYNTIIWLNDNYNKKRLNEDDDISWITENPINGTISAGSSQTVDLLVDATGLSTGTYDCNLIIDCNDPDNPQVSIPVHLNVTQTSCFNWQYVSSTGSNATIAVPLSANPQLCEGGLQSGDVIGVFFTRNDSLICGGYTIWNGTQNISITAWGDNAQTIIKDGFAEGEVIKFKIWDAGSCIEYVADVSYSQGNGNYSTNGIYVVSSLNAICTITQTVELNSGWNMISSYVDPENPDLDSITYPIWANMVLMKNGAGQVYWPEYGINQIGNWNPNNGYQIYMSQVANLNITGYPVEGGVPLTTGWNLIAYLRDCEMPIETAMAGIVTDMVLAKNGAGEVYWPEYGINQIGNMVPGEGYQIYMTAASTLNYPDCTQLIAGAVKGGEKKTEYNAKLVKKEGLKYYTGVVKNTGSNGTLVVSSSIFEEGDEVGVYSRSGLLTGGGLVEGGRGVITIWSDDGMTEEIDGAKDGEELYLKIWRKKVQKEVKLKITEITEVLPGNMKVDKLEYKADGLYVAEAEEEVQIPTSCVLEQNYPNPFNPSTVIRYGIPADGRVVLEIYDVIGQRVGILVNKEQKAGYYEISYRNPGLSSGVYFYRLQAGDFVSVKKMVMMK